MPLILGKGSEIKNPLPGIRMVPGMDRSCGSQTVKALNEVLHPSGDVRHAYIWVMNL